MFEAVRKNQKIAQAVLALIALSFAFGGFQFFSRGDSRPDVAKIGKTSISTAEFEYYLRNQPNFQDTPEARTQLLNVLVNQRLLGLYRADNHLFVTPQAIQAKISQDPQFQENGQFSKVAYENRLKNSGQSPAIYEANLASDIAIQQIVFPLQASFNADASATLLDAARQQEREVRRIYFPLNQYAGKVTLADNAAQDYYDAHLNEFEQPARLKAEYIVLDESAVMPQISITEEEIHADFEKNAASYGRPEERDIRHILIQVDSSTDEATLEAAQTRANEIYAQLKKDPKQFARLAKEHSQDPGSAANGGELGFSARGVMVPEFENVAFSLKENEISEPVKTDFGFHIIEVTKIRPAEIPPLEKVRAEIDQKLRNEEAKKRFAELAENFSNTVYEQGDDLKAIAEEFKLKLHQTNWIKPDTPVVGPYHSQELVKALFSDDAVQNKHSTPAIEVATNTLVAARITTFEPAFQQSFENVKGQIEQRLKTDEEKKMARSEGEALLAQLNKGEDTSATQWGNTIKLQRHTLGQPPEVLKAVFAAPVNKLPAYAGVTLLDGSYAVYRIDTVNQPVSEQNETNTSMMKAIYTQVTTNYDIGNFLAYLRQHYKVELQPMKKSAEEGGI